MRRAGLLLLALAAASCAPEPPPSTIRGSHPAGLTGTTWEVVQVGERPVVLRASLQLSIDPAGRISGTTGCNNLGGAVRYDPSTGAIVFADVVTTKRACVDPALAALEAGYVAGLRGAGDATIDESGRLVLSGAGPILVLVVGPERGAPPVVGPPASA